MTAIAEMAAAHNQEVSRNGPKKPSISLDREIS